MCTLCSNEMLVAHYDQSDSFQRTINLYIKQQYQRNEDVIFGSQLQVYLPRRDGRSLFFEVDL